MMPGGERSMAGAATVVRRARRLPGLGMGVASALAGSGFA